MDEGGHRKLEGSETGEAIKHRKLDDDAVDDAEPQIDPQSIARCYQLEALEMAIQRNTIVYLETGTGKTLIAVMLLRAYAHMIRKPSDSIAVFLVPTVVLVTQQARVIEANTDLKVGQFYGEMGVDFWSPKTWKKQLEKYEVFVMTHQILLDNLRHTYFQLGKIKVLIFDECHHARGRHPYACIMTEFYHRQLNSNLVNLPRIFGMTASLVNTKGSDNRNDYIKEIVEIESLMNAKVYTVASESVLAQHVPFSTPKIMLYNHVDMPLKLFDCLRDHLNKLKMKHLQAVQDQMLDGKEKETARKKIGRLHGTLLFCLEELGVWAAVQAAETLSCKENDIFFWGEEKDCSSVKTVRKFNLDGFKVLSNFLPADRCIGEDLKEDTIGGFLSTKVHCLIKSLLDYRVVPKLRCIVFVERVITAMVLQSLLCKIKDLSWLGIEYMAGNHSGLQSQTRREQASIVDSFQEGKAKVIIATQILEEGLDVQSCNLVVRFDQSKNVCSFIQSRGRARMQGSVYLLIVRSDDSSARMKVINYLKSGHIMREESLQQALLPCKPLRSEMYDEEFYCVETTGAKVTLSSSVSLIYFYCSRLPSDRYFKPVPRFVFNKESNICILHLPRSCPLHSLVVEGKVNKLKQIACLEASKKLHEIGELSDFLLPVFDVDQGYDDHVNGYELYKDKQVDYFPGEIVDSWPSFSRIGLYHCYMITLNQNFHYDISVNKIILVVKSDLGADTLSYSFNLEADRGTINVDLKYVGPVHLSHEQVLMARMFQVSVLHVLIRHDFIDFQKVISRLLMKQSLTDVTYLLLPTIGGKVDWHCVESAAVSTNRSKGQYHKNCVCPRDTSLLIQTIDGAVCRCMLENSVVYTPHNGNFYCITGILDACNGNSSFELKEGRIITYKKYFKIRHGIDLKNEYEPFLSGRHLFTVQNFLVRQPLRSHRKEKGISSAGVELPPELCKLIMSPISCGTLYSFSFVPSIMHRIECLLLAIKLKMLILDRFMQNDQVPAIKVLEAITTKKCHEEFSLESLETLGDSFLKYATSQHLFKSYEHYHQGKLTSLRTRVISNASLCQLGCARNLCGFIRTEQFDPTKWIIPGDCISFSDHKLYSIDTNTYNRGIRHIKSKVVADSVEALVGVCLSSAGELAAFHFLKWLGIGFELNKETVIERPIVGRAEKFVNLKDLEALLQYKFNDPSYLVEALTHGSYLVHDIPRCYQRLEFLGDAILDYLITIHLYKKYPGITPGLITDLRSASVNNACYAHVAAKAGLNKHILHASSDLHKQMTFYLSSFNQSFSGPSYGWEAGAALPKVLADVIESISGAIYVDSKFNKKIVWESIRPLLEPIVTPETIEHNPVRELNDLCTKKSYKLSSKKTLHEGQASYTTEVEAGGVIYRGTSSGTNKKMAKLLASRDVLRTLKTAISEGNMVGNPEGNHKK